MLPQNIQLFINKLENVKDEPDGGYKADCPVCALEDKGSGKLRVFPDGNLVCYRFAGTGETRSHIEDIRKALGVEAAIKPSVLVTKSLLDGKLKLECSPADRGKVLVVARNCSSTLARDTFYLDRSADRSKFISSLSLSEEDQKPVAQALLALCDEFENVRNAIETDSNEGVVENTSFIALPDGRVAEQIVCNGEAKFALYDPALRSSWIVGSIEDDGKTYLPVQDELLLKGGLRVPSGIEEYGDERSLRREIEEYLHRSVDLAPFHRRLLSLYVLFSWVYDRFSELSYIRLLGEPGNGKSRAGYVTALICRRPLLLVDPSASLLFRVIATYGPTLFVDEFNPVNTQDDGNQLMPILNSGFMRDFLVGRSEKGADGQFTTKLFSPFCPKIIASYKPLDSAAFESRGHQLLMVKTERRDIPLSATETMRQDALHLSNKLLLFRLRNYHRDWETGLRQAQDALWQENLAPRAIQISAGLYSLMDSAEDRADFIKMLKGRESRESEDKQASFDGQLITTLHSQIIATDADGQVDWLSGITPEEFEDGKPVRYWRTDSIAERMNEDREEKRKLTKEYVGKAIRKLHLNTAKIKTRGADRDKPAIQWDRNRVRQLFLSFGLPLPKNFPENTSENASPASPASPNTLFATGTDICTGTRDGDALGTEGGLSEAPQVGTQTELHLSPSAVPTQLIDIEGESGLGDSGDAGDAENEGTEKKFSEDVCELIALDTETEAFDKKRDITPRNCRMIGLALCYDGERADYETDREAWPLLMPESEQTVVMHNAKFDLGVLKRSGLPQPEKWEDTLIAAHLLDEYSSHGLKPLAKEHLGIEDPITFSEADRMRLLDPEVFNEYARNDARYTYRLWPRFKRELDRQGLMEVYELEKAVLPVVMKMEERGLRIDIAQMDAMRAEVETETTRLESEIYEHAGCKFNLHSPEKTAAILYDKLGLPCPKKTKEGKRSVGKDVLEELSDVYPHPVIRSLLEYRELDKLASTFINVLPKFADEQGRIRPEFKQLGAKTGRFSCSDPNVQQIPSRSALGKRLRESFIADEGNVLVVADYSQMELRVLAHYSRDPLLVEAYTSEHETDLHALTASRMFGKAIDAIEKNERTVAKMINFGIAYGITPIGLFNRLRPAGLNVSEEQCEEFVRNYFKTYPGVRKFLDKAERVARERHYVRSFFGRRRRLKGNERGLSSREIRQAQNFIIQATAADLAKDAMVKLYQALPEGADLIATIHDEFIVECRKEQAEQVRDLMTQVMQQTPEGFTVPMKVEAKIGLTWGECK